VSAKKTLSPSQYKAYIHYVDSHWTRAEAKVFDKRKAAAAKRAETKHHAAKAKHKGGKHKVRAKKAGLVSVPLGTSWILAGNDVLPSCAAAAVANSLLAATGYRAGDDAALALFETAGEVTEDILDCVLTRGIAGIRPAAVTRGGGGLAALLLPEGRHVVAVTSGHAVTWGGTLPWELLAPYAEETWTLTWE
jgi:hypothetical protein